MKHVGLLVSFLIFGYSIAMNTLVVLRQKELEELGKYRQSVGSFLGTGQERERWLGIYKDHKKIGYTGFHLEKVPVADEELDFEFWSTVETVVKFDLFGMGSHLRLNAQLTQDNALKPVFLSGQLALGNLGKILFAGKREGEGFLLSVNQDETEWLKIKLPLEEFHLGDGFMPTLPIAEFEVGDTFQVRSFDPIHMKPSSVNVEVVAVGEREIAGLLMEVYTLESTFGTTVSTTLVTRDGSVLRQQFGDSGFLGGVVLRRESKKRARKGFAP